MDKNEKTSDGSANKPAASPAFSVVAPVAATPMQPAAAEHRNPGTALKSD